MKTLKHFISGFILGAFVAAAWALLDKIFFSLESLYHYSTVMGACATGYAFARMNEKD